MASQRQKYQVTHFLLGVYVSIFSRKHFHVCKANIRTEKVHFKNLQFLVVKYDMRYLRCTIDRRCLNGSGLFPLFKQVLESEMT